MKELKDLKTGQEIIWTDILKEIEDLKALTPVLDKKNWKQLLMGKLLEMVVGGVISETVSKQIAEAISPIIGRLLLNN